MESYRPLAQIVKDVLMPALDPPEHARCVEDAVDEATATLHGVAVIHGVALTGHQARLLTITAINAYTARLEEFARGAR